MAVPVADAGGMDGQANARYGRGMDANALILPALMALAVASIALIWPRLVPRAFACRQGTRTLSSQASIGRPIYGAKPLLTAWERRALLSIRAQIPTGYYVCPQVRLADMLIIEEADPWRRRHALARVSAYSLDFVIIELTTGRVVLAVELDDRTHDRPERAARDRFVEDALRAAGVPIARFRAHDQIDIRRHFQEAEAFAG